MIKAISKYRLSFFALGFLLFINGAQAQFDIPNIPPLEEQTSLYDYIALLTPQQQESLRNKLVRYSDTTSTQIVVAIISTTKGEDIAMLGARWGENWGIGQANKDNGILILLAKDDRTVDINTGYGIEYRITDRMAERIINSYMIPEFKLGNFYEGLDNGTEIMFQMLQGEFVEETDDSSYLSRNWDGIIILAVVLFIFIMIIIGVIAGKKGYKGGSGWDTVTHSSSGSSRSYGSSSSSSFGGGFGGGSFGGGGASGSW